MAEEASIRVSIDASGAKAGAGTYVSATNQITAASARAKTSVGGLGSELLAIKNRVLGLPAAFAGLAASLGAAAVAKTAASYEQLQNQLITVTGSAHNGAVAFAALKKFAVETPFELADLTDAFNRLTAVGVQPTIEQMKGLGEIAAGLGQEFGSVANAIVSQEAETFKRFGIRLQTEGDKFKVTFKGVTREIEKDTGQLLQLISAIGQTEFAGGMTRQVDTVSGAFSNLSDAFGGFSDKVGKAGLNEGLKNIAVALTEVTNSSDGLATSLGESSLEVSKLVTKAIELMNRYEEARNFAKRDIEEHGYFGAGGMFSPEGYNRRKSYVESRDFAEFLAGQDTSIEGHYNRQGQSYFPSDPDRDKLRQHYFPGRIVQPGQEEAEKAAAKLAERMAELTAQAKVASGAFDEYGRNTIETALKMGVFEADLKDGILTLEEFGAHKAELEKIKAALDTIEQSEAIQKLKEDLEAAGLEMENASKQAQLTLFKTLEDLKFETRILKGEFQGLDDDTVRLARDAGVLDKPEEVARIQEVVAAHRQASEESLTIMERLGEESAAIGRAFGSFFAGAVRGGDAAKQAMARLLQELIALGVQLLIIQPLLDSFKTTGSGGGKTSAGNQVLGGILSGATSALFGGLFGFASGGSFDVKGVGGTDSQLVAFKATPGENVRVSTPAQRGGDVGEVSVVINNNGPPINVAEKQQRRTIRGIELELMLDNRISERVARPDSRTRKLMGLAAPGSDPGGRPRV